jgi:hypothetical protein
MIPNAIGFGVGPPRFTPRDFLTELDGFQH